MELIVMTKQNVLLRYAILVIGLYHVFSSFFIELIYKKNDASIPIYILIGFALCLFYALLLSISEYIAFGISYLIASIATIGLISWFSASILKDKNLAIAITTILTAIYILLFIYS
jgi:inner membrane protein